MKKIAALGVVGMLVAMSFTVVVVQAAERLYPWRCDRAFTGTPAEAVRLLPLPAEAMEALSGAVAKVAPLTIVLQRGDRFSAVVIGAGEVKQPAIAAWGTATGDLKTLVAARIWSADVGGKRYIVAFACRSWALSIEPVKAIVSLPAPFLRQEQKAAE